MDVCKNNHHLQRIEPKDSHVQWKICISAYIFPIPDDWINGAERGVCIPPTINVLYEGIGHPSASLPTNGTVQDCITAKSAGCWSTPSRENEKSYLVPAIQRKRQVTNPSNLGQGTYRA